MATLAAYQARPRYAVFPVLAFDYYVRDIHDLARVGDIFASKAAAQDLADRLNAGTSTPADVSSSA